jgi:uncharacterized repeat protein (TIGR03803 family)
MSTLRFCKATLLVFVLSLLASMPASAQQFNTLLFNGANGANPLYSVLVQGPDGDLYGTGAFGGSQLCGIFGVTTDCGSVYKITPAGKLTTLYNFCTLPGCSDGWTPYGGLTLATDGNFYGTTTYGGICGVPYDAPPCGTVFRITPTGHLTTLYSFCSLTNCADGAGPIGKLLQAPDGNFYGTTSAGGIRDDDFPYGGGTIFRMTPAGQLTTIFTFDAGSFTPYGGLVLGNDGNFYGTTTLGGDQGYACMYVPGCGTIYRLTPAGDFSVIYNFCATDCLDGADPNGDLLLGADGKFYGVAEIGGQGDQGTFFSITPDGQFTTLYKFCHQLNCTDGSNPSGTLIQGTDGNFYGGTSEGGNTADCQMTGCGVVFKITPGGAETVLHTFADADGSDPSAGLTQATTGDFFGTTFEGGVLNQSCWSLGCGTIFKMSLGFGPFVSFVRNPAKVGQEFGILGQGLKGATAVSLNGTAAKFKVKSNTVITATVPAGASTGYVTVTTPSGVLTSNVPFQVLP